VRIAQRTVPKTAHKPTTASRKTPLLLEYRKLLHNLQAATEPVKRAAAKAKNKIRVKAKARVKAKDRAKGRVRVKGKAKVRVKVKARAKVKVKGRAKVKDRLKGRVNGKDRAKGRGKAKYKVKARAKDRVKDRGKVKGRGREKANPVVAVGVGGLQTEVKVPADRRAGVPTLTAQLVARRPRN